MQFILILQHREKQALSESFDFVYVNLCIKEDFTVKTQSSQ